MVRYLKRTTVMGHYRIQIWTLACPKSADIVQNLTHVLKIRHEMCLKSENTCSF